MFTQNLHKIAACLAAIFFVFTYLAPLNSRLLWQPDETRYAEISREMLLRDNWIVPYFLNVRYFEKPVAGYWINNISQIIFGYTNFAVRFGAVFSTMISSGLIYWLAMIMWSNRNIAFVATLMYVSMFLVFTIGTYSVLDPMFSMWITACMLCCFWLLKAKTVAEKLLTSISIGLTCGIAFMTKGLIALAIPVIVMLPVIIYQKRLTEILKLGVIIIISAALISFPWVLAINRYEPDYWNYFFWVEHIQRFASENAQHKSPFLFYIPIILLGVIPWLGFLPGSLLQSWRRVTINQEMIFLLFWFIAPFLFFSIAKGKLLTYILPVMPPLALMMAKYAVDCVKNHNMAPMKFNGFINIVFSIFVMITLMIMEFFFEHPLYDKTEWPKLTLVIIVFVIWSIISYFSLVSNSKYWLLVSLCSIALSLSIGYALPKNIIDIKLPQQLIRQNISLLQKSKFILADNVGVSAGLAWELRRSDIFLYETPGELRYGLDYPDSQFRLIKKGNFAQWLNQACKAGQISVVIVLRNNKILPDDLPKPDHVSSNTKIAILTYYQKP
ncbi:MAG: lipid IV(A) 4-amino-4-deoxy-L-arabinosyltransferase [Candidatus Arsenophonus melophagi]|nr:lipid IV(A) 4-amino-4-deoxy-L-arabinosyltransferase [Candidatus Arsenophonus melophagi]